jgi:hypothetical protein
MTDSLTRKQKNLVKELRDLTSLLGLDFEDIKLYRKKERTARLEVMKRHFIRGEVVHRYTLVDEELGVLLTYYFFGPKANFIRLWKTKRFKNFNYYVLEVLSFMEKLRFVKEIIPVPKRIAADIERLNNLRNGIAHSYFPENLRSARPTWKGKGIFSLDGLKAFQEDIYEIHQFFVVDARKARRLKRVSATSPMISTLETLLDSPSQISS